MAEEQDPGADGDATQDDESSSDEQLGDAGVKALEAFKARARTAEKAAKTAEAELEKLRKATMSEQEKAVAEARAVGRAEAVAEANDRLLRAEIRATAAGKLADPADAAALLGDLSTFLTADGEPNAKAITSAIDELVKAKPYLAPQGARPWPLPGGGAKPSNGQSINDVIRQRAGR